MTAGLTLEAVEIHLGARRLLTVDAHVAPGQTLTVAGPSGSGKSTLFSLIGGFLDPAFKPRGRVLLNGRDLLALAPEERRVGLLFQDALLFPHMSVGANLAFAIPAAVRGRRARRSIAEAMLGDVDLRGFFDRDPATLSGGQAARAALARTLLAAPQALLLDEPFSRLDRPLRRSIRDLVFMQVRERSIPALLVTHDLDDAPPGSRIVDLGADVAESVRIGPRRLECRPLRPN